MSPAIGASKDTRPRLSTRERSSLSTVQAARINPSKQPGGWAVTVNSAKGGVTSILVGKFSPPGGSSTVLGTISPDGAAACFQRSLAELPPLASKYSTRML
jgi:hypothetical protein